MVSVARLHQADDVAHAQDAAGDAFGVEILQRVLLLADADQLDRGAGDGAHRQRRTAAGVAVHAGQHDAGDRQRVVERLGGVDRVLAGHRIDHQQRLRRVGGGADLRGPRPSAPGRSTGGRRCRG